MNPRPKTLLKGVYVLISLLGFSNFLSERTRVRISRATDSSYTKTETLFVQTRHCDSSSPRDENQGEWSVTQLSLRKQFFSCLQLAFEGTFYESTFILGMQPKTRPFPSNPYRPHTDNCITKKTKIPILPI